MSLAGITDWNFWLAFAGIAITWLLADARSKSKLLFLDEKLLGITVTSNRTSERLNNIEVLLGQNSQDREQIHRQIDRLDNAKASKEVVDGFRHELVVLRVEMDKRFDRLERIMETKTNRQGSYSQDSEDADTRNS